MARLLLPLIIASVSKALGWGLTGSYAGALVAQNYLTLHTTSYLQNLLGDTTDVFLANAAAWAQEYSGSASGNFTMPYYYLPADDAPPRHCNVFFQRDCPLEGCLATAISNYTAYLRDTAQTRQTRQRALRMLVALITSNTEPANNDKTDGRGVAVLWNQTSTSLYQVWHSGMPDALAGGVAISDAQGWANYLIKNVDAGASGMFAGKTSWLADLSLCWTAYTSLLWSADANAYMCSAVMPGGPAALQGQELSGSYFEANANVVHGQIAKAGYRLAAWLNLIVAGHPALTVPLTAKVPMCNTTVLTNPGTTTPS